MNGYARGRSELTVGIYAIAAVAVFALLFGGLTSRGLIRSTTDLFIRLPAADGLLKGDAVLFRGVPVGEVRAIEFGGSGDVVVLAKLRRRVPLTRAAVATLVPVDMFGRQSIVLSEGSEPGGVAQDGAAGSGRTAPEGVRSLPALADGDTIAGARPASLTGRVDRLGRQAERLLGDSTVALLRGALAGIGGAGDQVSRVGERAAALLASQTRDLESVLAATDSLLQNLSAATDPAEVELLRADLRQAASSLARTTARMDTASDAVVRVLTRLERGDGTLGRALNDPELYDRAVAAVAQLERLITDVRDHPGRYVTVRLF